VVVILVQLLIHLVRHRASSYHNLMAPIQSCGNVDVRSISRDGAPGHHWISYGSSQFVGAAATWLESFLTRSSNASWVEFVLAVQTRFQRNQHTVLLRKLYHISQTGTIENYL
jgi:hypothetical protein